MGWHVATTCHLRRLFVFLCISGGTYIYVPIYVHTIKIHDILNKVISLIVSKVSLAQFYFLFDGPGMSFVEGIVCPQASQTCCDNWSFSKQAFKTRFSSKFSVTFRFFLSGKSPAKHLQLTWCKETPRIKKLSHFSPEKNSKFLS